MVNLKEAYRIAKKTNKKLYYGVITEIREIQDGWIFWTNDRGYGNWPVFVNKNTGKAEIFMFSDTRNVIAYNNAKVIELK